MPRVLSILTTLIALVRGVLRSRSELLLENLAFRQQLAVLQRRTGRAPIGRFDRLFRTLVRLRVNSGSVPNTIPPCFVFGHEMLSS